MLILRITQKAIFCDYQTQLIYDSLDFQMIFLKIVNAINMTTLKSSGIIVYHILHGKSFILKLLRAEVQIFVINASEPRGIIFIVVSFLNTYCIQ